VLPVLSVFVILDGISGVNAGTVRALGRQAPVTWGTFVSLYLVGLPLAYYMGFNPEIGLKGFWYGYIIAKALVDIIVIYLVVSAKWKAEYILKPKSDKAILMSAKA